MIPRHTSHIDQFTTIHTRTNSVFGIAIKVQTAKLSSDDNDDRVHKPLTRTPHSLMLRQRADARNASNSHSNTFAPYQTTLKAFTV